MCWSSRQRNRAGERRHPASTSPSAEKEAAPCLTSLVRNPESPALRSDLRSSCHLSSFSIGPNSVPIILCALAWLFPQKQPYSPHGTAGERGVENIWGSQGGTARKGRSRDQTRANCKDQRNEPSALSTPRLFSGCPCCGETQNALLAKCRTEANGWYPNTQQKQESFQLT